MIVGLCAVEAQVPTLWSWRLKVVDAVGTLLTTSLADGFI